MVEHGAILFPNEYFGVLAAQPHGRGGGRCAHDNLHSVLRRKRHGTVEPCKVVDTLARFYLRPGKFAEVSKLKAQLVHALEVALPLTLIPVLRVIVGAGQRQVFILEPLRFGLG